MKNLVLAAIAALSLGVGVANAQSLSHPPAIQNGGQQTSTEFSLTNENVGGSVYQRDVPAYPGETRHVIGGETFYFDGDVGGQGGNG